MKKMLLVASLLLYLPMLAQAQDAPKVDVFAGYSYLRVQPGSSGPHGRPLGSSLCRRSTTFVNGTRAKINRYARPLSK
jgi:hypothetical protein